MDVYGTIPLNPYTYYTIISPIVLGVLRIAAVGYTRRVYRVSLSLNQEFNSPTLDYGRPDTLTVSLWHLAMAVHLQRREFEHVCPCICTSHPFCCLDLH